MRSDDDMRSDYVPNFVKPRNEYSTIQIILGVAGGVLLASLIGFFVRLYMMKAAAEAVMQEANKITVNMQMQMQRDLEQQKLREEQRRQQGAAVQRAQYAAQAAAQDEKARKEDAWAKFYKKPAHCDLAEGQAFIECANDHIRAKRRFEEMWETGKL